MRSLIVPACHRLQHSHGYTIDYSNGSFHPPSANYWKTRPAAKAVYKASNDLQIAALHRLFLAQPRAFFLLELARASTTVLCVIDRGRSCVVEQTGSVLSTSNHVRPSLKHSELFLSAERTLRHRIGESFWICQAGYPASAPPSSRSRQHGPGPVRLHFSSTPRVLIYARDLDVVATYHQRCDQRT